MIILWVRAWPDRVSCRLFAAAAVARAFDWLTADDKVLNSSWTWFEENSIGVARQVSVTGMASRAAATAAPKVPEFDPGPVSVDSEFGLVPVELLVMWLKASLPLVGSVWINLLSFSVSFSWCAETYRTSVASIEQVRQSLRLESIWNERHAFEVNILAGLIDETIDKCSVPFRR